MHYLVNWIKMQSWIVRFYYVLNTFVFCKCVWTKNCSKQWNEANNQLLHFGLIEEIMRRTMLLKITCFCRFDMEESNTSSSLIFYLSSLYSCLDLSTNGCKMRLIEMYDKIIDLILQAMYFCHFLRLKLN